MCSSDLLQIENFIKLSGDFPNQNPHVDGLSVWTERDAALTDVDLVVWHIFGMTHVRTCASSL